MCVYVQLGMGSDRSLQLATFKLCELEMPCVLKSSVFLASEALRALPRVLVHDIIRHRCSSSARVGHSDWIKLYENKNIRPKLFIAVSAVASVQLVFWAFLAHFALTELQDIERPRSGKKEPTKFLSLKLRVIVSLVSLGAGLFFAVSAVMYPLRVVSSLSWNEISQTVQLVTHTPLGGLRTVNTSLSYLTCSRSRLAGPKKGLFGLKVRGHAFYYLLDQQILDTSHNVRLFDRLIATRQKIY